MEAGKQNRPFVKEHIIPSKRKRQQEFLKTLGRMFLYGAVFGLAAGIFFVIAGDLFGKEREPVEYKEQTVDETKEETGETTEPGAEGAKDDVVQDETDGQGMETENQNDISVQNTEDQKLTDKKVNTSGYQKKISRWNQSIVAVYAQSEWSGEQSVNEHGTGFGIVIAKDKKWLHFLTQYKSLPSDTNSLKAEFFDGAVLSAKLTGKDEDADIAIISVELENIPESILKKAEVIKMGDAGLLQTGCSIFLLGRPNGFLYSADTGIISGTQEKAYIMDYSLDIYPTNISCNENAAGFVLSANGKLLGMITSAEETVFDEKTVVFSGISSLKRVITKLQEREPVIYCGIRAENIPQQTRMSMGITNGIYVTEIVPNSPAAQAGIRVGDILQKIEDTEISTVVDFYTRISEYDGNTPVDVYAVRVSADKKKENKYIVRLQEKE